MAIVATNLLDTLPHLQSTLLHQLASVMLGEIREDKSEQPGYSFLAWHCSYYNRYAEKVHLFSFYYGAIFLTQNQGHDAPKDQAHPHYLKKTSKTRVNVEQRAPKASKEMEDNPEEAALLAEMIHLITIIVEHHVRFFLLVSAFQSDLGTGPEIPA